MKKVTAFLPAQLLASVQSQAGLGVTETLKLALEEMARRQFYARMLEMRGKIKFDDFDLKELREDKEYDAQGYVIRS